MKCAKTFHCFGICNRIIDLSTLNSNDATADVVDDQWRQDQFVNGHLPCRANVATL